MLKLLGASEAQASSEAQAIMNLETELAKVSLDVTSQRDPHNIYHMMPDSGLQALTPALNWEHFYQGTGSAAIQEINVAEPEFFKGLNQVIAETDLPTIKAYLRWQLVHSIPGTVLPRALDEEKFDFDGRKLVGIPEQRATLEALRRQYRRGIGRGTGQGVCGAGLSSGQQRTGITDDS